MKAGFDACMVYSSVVKILLKHNEREQEHTPVKAGLWDPVKRKQSLCKATNEGLKLISEFTATQFDYTTELVQRANN